MSENSTESSHLSNGQLLLNQKLRTTCNACQQAKIRCSHSHPCDRCVSHGFECVYSISQPLGRPAKKKGSRLTAGVQANRAEGEVAGRSTRRSAARPPRPAPGRRRQRVPRGRVRPESSPEERGESHRGDSGISVTRPESDEVPGTTENLLEIPELPSGDRIQDQEPNSNAGNDDGDLESIVFNLDLGSSSRDPFNLPSLSDFQESPHCYELAFNFRTEDYTPSFGLTLDEPPMRQFVDGGPSSLHAAAPGTDSRSPFNGEVNYPFCLAPNARQVSGTIQDPWRIMELPSSEVAHGKLDTSSSQSLSPEEIDYECLSGDSSSTRCDCNKTALGEVARARRK